MYNAFLIYNLLMLTENRIRQKILNPATETTILLAHYMYNMKIKTKPRCIYHRYFQRKTSPVLSRRTIVNSPHDKPQSLCEESKKRKPSYNMYMCAYTHTPTRKIPSNQDRIAAGVLYKSHTRPNFFSLLSL